LLERIPSTKKAKQRKNNNRTLYPSLKSWMLFAFGTFKAIYVNAMDAEARNCKAKAITHAFRPGFPGGASGGPVSFFWTALIS
jgi:hypothetical protein